MPYKNFLMKFLGSIINSVGEIQLSLIGTIFVYAKIGHDILISSKPGSTIFRVLLRSLKIKRALSELQIS